MQKKDSSSPQSPNQPTKQNNTTKKEIKSSWYEDIDSTGGSPHFLNRDRFPNPSRMDLEIRSRAQTRQPNLNGDLVLQSIRRRSGLRVREDKDFLCGEISSRIKRVKALKIDIQNRYLLKKRRDIYRGEENQDGANRASSGSDGPSNKKLKVSNPEIPQNYENPNHRFGKIGGTLELITDIKDGIKKLRPLRGTIHRKQRTRVLHRYPILKKIANCNSKMQLVKIFSSLSSKWKRLIRSYLERCFLMHLHLRQIKQIGELMRNRQNIYDALEDPEILNNKVNFGNNLVKNFCKGLANFVIRFVHDLIREGMLSQPRRSFSK